MELTGARFGALGVRGPDDSLISFVHAGIDEVAVSPSGHHSVGKGVLDPLLGHSGSLRLDDLIAHPATVGFPEHCSSMDALLSVPIIIRQKVFGSLYLTEPTRLAAFSKADEIAVRELASAAALAIDNARLFDRVRSTAQWTEASRTMTMALLSAVDLHARLQLIAACACELTGAEQAIVLMPSEDDLPVDEVDTLVVSNAVGLHAEIVLDQRVLVAGSTTGAVFRSGTPVITAALGHPLQAFTDVGRRSAIVMPLRSEQTLRGVIAVARNSGQPSFDVEHLNLMSDFADHAAMALTLANALEHSRYLTVLNDRERIGHELHDHVIQRLFAAGIDLQGTIARSRSSEITDRLNRTVTDLQAMIEDIRTTIFDLHSTGTQQIGFRQRIEAAVADLTENGAVVTTLQMSGSMSGIGDDLAGHAESVILEAVSNAVRHSGATQLTVEVAVADEVDITVTDDGCGISTYNERRSGLVNMASRAEQIGGHCHLATPPGGGTQVHWTVPLPDS
jgi:signal transduction histidine kinase